MRNVLPTLLLCSFTIFWLGTKLWKVQGDKRCYRSRSLGAAARIIGALTRRSRYVTGMRYKGRVKILRSPFDCRADTAALVEPTRSLPGENFLRSKRVPYRPALRER